MDEIIVEVIKMLAGILFMVPLKSAFVRISDSLKTGGGQSFLEYNFPNLYKQLTENKKKK